MGNENGMITVAVAEWLPIIHALLNKVRFVSTPKSSAM